MDLDFSEEQDMLRTTVHKLCEEFANLSVLRALESDTTGFNSSFWAELSASGLCGLRVEEQYGGVGMGAVDCAVVYEEMGRSLATSPHFASALLCARLLALTDPQSPLLRKIASGEIIVTPAWQETIAYSDIRYIETCAQRDGSKLILRGQKILVPFANSADMLIVLAKLEDKLSAILVPKVDIAERIQLQPNMANEKLFAVDFGETVLNAQDVLLAEDVEHAWDQAMLEGLLALSAQSVGGALQILETTIAYAKEREQFGRPIGAFQSIAHYLADAATEIQGVRYLAYQACWAFDNGLPLSKHALMPKLQCNAVLRRTALTAVQIHGGMGFTLEADPQLYYRRAKSQQLQYWDPMYLEERIATEVFS
jgi:alkylation response protein AidB-like acyl-CoA dehydrogenase